MKFSYWLKENTEQDTGEWVSGDVPASIRRQGHIERYGKPQEDDWYDTDKTRGPYRKIIVPLNIIKTQHDLEDGTRDEPEGERLKNIEKYSQLKTPFPPILLIPTRNGYFVSDGNHRVEAAKKRGDSTIEALIPEKYWKQLELKNKERLTEMPYVFANNPNGFDLELEKYATFDQLNQRLKEIFSGVKVEDKYGNFLQLSTPESKETFINDLAETNSPNFMEWVLNKFGDKFKGSHSGRIPLANRSQQEMLAVQNWLLTFLK